MFVATGKKKTATDLRNFIQMLGINLFRFKLLPPSQIFPKPQPQNATLKLLVHAKTIEFPSFYQFLCQVLGRASRATGTKSPGEDDLELTKS
jgi:hypothetical protein